MTLLIALLLVPGAYLVAVIEDWTVTGRVRPSAPLVGGLALLGRESLVPRLPDRILFETAPPLLLVAAVLSMAVLPLAPDTTIANLATGALFVNSALAYVMVAIVLAGWGPNGAYAMIGGWRFLGQLVAYSMLIVMPITAVAMRAQSLVTTDVVASQTPLPNAVTQPLGFVLFTLAAMAVAFLPPFDLPNAGDLGGGVFGEYTGGRLAVLRFARLVLICSLATAVTVFYLGGWLGPLLPGGVWTVVKTYAVIAVMLVGGRALPRIRSDHLLEWSWKYGIPLALTNIFWVGITVLAVKG